jgi:hypothetical protein
MTDMVRDMEHAASVIARLTDHKHAADDWNLPKEAQEAADNLRRWADMLFRMEGGDDASPREAMIVLSTLSDVMYTAELIMRDGELTTQQREGAALVRDEIWHVASMIHARMVDGDE